ncbi:helix-turn-helix domain-containing protein [Nocardioides pelophilus]|uniref:helix-turn-helix domain-containing protein n=1 Tax=Nocardioides pelophilus TaxID=2172019 RepID=UPI001C7EB53B|nr:helix-turn-helix domain-containing protein [Nocardioides pelophilus]
MDDNTFDTDLLHADPTPAEAPEPAAEAERADQVEVRRNVVLSAAVGVVAAVLTGAFALRAFGDGSALDWAAFAVLGMIMVLHLAAVADGRAPLLVADGLGVRLREGAEWQGIAWDDIECMEHLPRRLPFRDGHLLVVGESGQQLIVPLTLATRVVGATTATVSDELAALADGRADVVEVVADLEEDAELLEPGDGYADPADPDGSADVTDAIPPLGEGTVILERRGIAAEVEKRFRSPFARPAPDQADPHDTDDTIDTLEPISDDASTDELAAIDPTDDPTDDPADDQPTGGGSPQRPPAPGRPVVFGARVEVQRRGDGRVSHDTGSHPTIGANALRSEPAVHVEQAEGTEVEHSLTVVLDDLVVHPAPEPVIGPQLEAARQRLRLTVDQLSERTRIRPHVIEAIEVDDFGSCGGDFYARGHLRTLARVLGIDAGPLVAAYDETYADAPVDPRRVFASELATGVGGSIRSTRGGRNWSVLIAAVMAAVLIWSIARLVMDGPVELGKTPVLNQSGGLSKAQKVPAVPVTLTATSGGAKLVVRDGNGDIQFKGALAFGQTSKLEIVPPVRIWTSDGSVTAAVDCKDPAPLGDTGAEASKTPPAC